MDSEKCREVESNTNNLMNFSFEDGLITFYDFDLNLNFNNVDD